MCTTTSNIYVGAGQSKFRSSCLLNGCFTNRAIFSAPKILLNRTSDINCAFYGFLVCVSMKASLIPPAHWCPWRFVILIWLWVGPRDLILTERLLYWHGMSLWELGHTLRSILLILSLSCIPLLILGKPSATLQGFLWRGLGVKECC